MTTQYTICLVDDHANSFLFVANVEATSAKAAVALGAKAAGDYVAIPARSLKVYSATPVERPQFSVSG
jgi:hypothetical protein